MASCEIPTAPSSSSSPINQQQPPPQEQQQERTRGRSLSMTPSMISDFCELDLNQLPARKTRAKSFVVHSASVSLDSQLSGIPEIQPTKARDNTTEEMHMKSSPHKCPSSLQLPEQDEEQESLEIDIPMTRTVKRSNSKIFRDLHKHMPTSPTDQRVVDPAHVWFQHE